ncbi:hypothetical protein WSM22_07770 [Cytophagales bacterium WSM2-2]|nr:hypothetical protein WSM22_07770 [Cytophagales bacterium WSM2-2]
MYRITLIFTICIKINSFAQSNEQSIAPELAGKWCYINTIASSADAITNSCINLNDDGSFEFTIDATTLPKGISIPLQQNDTGKWWVKDNRLFYSSQSSGQGSFSFQKINHPRLENTPMIVVNGISFATATPRDPW